MEPTATPPAKKTSWGVLIGLLLILIVIVASALYVFDQRLHASAAPAATVQAV